MRIRKSLLFSLYLTLTFICFSVVFFSIGFPEDSIGKSVEIFSFVFSKTHLGQLFTILSLLSFLLAFSLALLRGKTKPLIGGYLIISCVLGGIWLQKAHSKGEARLEEIKAGNALKAESLSNPTYLTIPDTHITSSDIAELANFSSVESAYKARNNLVRFIWKQSSLPLTEMPTNVIQDVDIKQSSSFRNLARVDEINIEMEYGFLSKSYYFHPERKNGKLFLYHQGHHPHGAMVGGLDTIRKLLEQGYTVLAFSMLGTAENTLPENIDTGSISWKRLKTESAVQHHESLQVLEQEHFSPLKLFLHPITVALNYVLSQQNYTRISMTGISGGGWTTTVYAAIDPRVDLSYPVAGSLPRYLAVAPPNGGLGDYEQRHPILQSLGYLRLYVLGATGRKRHQRQILNQFDECCFKGVGAYSYSSAVLESANSLGIGGSYALSVLPQTKHNISEVAFKLIMYDEERFD